MDGDSARFAVCPGTLDAGSDGFNIGVCTVVMARTEHRTLTITRKGSKVVTIPLAPRTARAIDLAIGERTGGAVFRAPGPRQPGPARHYIVAAYTAGAAR